MKFIPIIFIALFALTSSAEEQQTSHTSTNMSENAGYLLDLLVGLNDETQKNRDTLKEIRDQLVNLTNIVTDLQEQEENYLDLANTVQSIKEVQVDVVDSLAATSDRMDSVNARVYAIANKLDADDVYLLDTDYSAIINAL